jgi:glycosyltransferase involved in cell wall biosynthesis
MTSARKSNIVLLSGNSLCHNPRVMKEAAALARAGYDVQVLGMWLDPTLKTRDLELVENAPFRFVPVLDCTLPGFGAVVADFLRRARRKSANVLHALTGRESPSQLGFGIERLMACAQDISADFYIAHSEPCMHVAWRLLRLGKRVGVDMEDWFSQDLLPEARRRRPVRLLESLERELLVRGAYASCPSRAMSAALAETYGGPQPAVVYNAFSWAEREGIDGLRKDRRDASIISICWYSQTLGPGRGLEDLVAAIQYLKHDMEIHLRGYPAPGFEDWIRTRVPDHWRNKIIFHPLVTNDRLLSRVAEHDIGFAGEMNYCRSRDLTVTNKILHYLLGGLAVVASDTAGQREVASHAPEAVRLYPSGNPQALADRLNELLASPELLRRTKVAALTAAQRTFCWERQEGVLLDAIVRGLDRTLTSNLMPDV